jgi:hypothetical protein
MVFQVESWLQGKALQMLPRLFLKRPFEVRQNVE